MDARLAAADILWLTTVAPDGQPQSSPVWFVWDGEVLHVASAPGAGKVANIRANPRVSVHLDGAAPGGLVVTGEGRAELVGAVPDAYAAKYAAGFERLGTTATEYLAEFSTAVAITPTRWRTFTSE